MPAERVTVTLPPELLRGLDHRSSNRRRFIQQAVRHELVRLRREELERSLATPYVETEELAEAGSVSGRLEFPRTRWLTSSTHPAEPGSSVGRAGASARAEQKGGPTMTGSRAACLRSTGKAAPGPSSMTLKSREPKISVIARGVRGQLTNDAMANLPEARRRF